MKRIITLTIVLCLVFVTIVPIVSSIDWDHGLPAPAADTRATTHYVGSGQTYTLIQDAINAASDGDTIIVKEGEYDEYVKVNKTVTLLGEGPTKTKFMDGWLSVRNPWCNISGFYFEIQDEYPWASPNQGFCQASVDLQSDVTKGQYRRFWVDRERRVKERQVAEYLGGGG